MAYYYNGRGRNKTLTLKKTVNGETTTISTHDLTAAIAGTDYGILTDTEFAQLTTEQYNARLAAFIESVKTASASTYPEFSSMNLAQGAWVMVPGAVGEVPEG